MKFPKAQEAYETSLAMLDDIDTTELFERILPLIQEANSIGAFTINVQPIDPLIAEKGAIELEKLGYHVSVFNSNKPIDMGDGSFKPGALLHINFKMMPPNTRDKHTV